MNNTFIDLYNEFMVLANKGDEQGARDFLVSNFQKFPQDVQDKLTFAFFEEALTAEAANIKAVADMQKEGLDAINKIGKAKKILEDQKKIEDLRSGLTK